MHIYVRVRICIYTYAILLQLTKSLGCIYVLPESKMLAYMWCAKKLSLTICRLLPLYFPRNKSEEEMARLKLPQDVGDENGETSISDRRIRITALPAPFTSFPSYIPNNSDREANGDNSHVASTRSLLSEYIQVGNVVFCADNSSFLNADLCRWMHILILHS